MGYRVIYDKELSLEKAIEELIRKVSETEGYVYVKRRQWNLTSIAKARSTRRKTKLPE